MTVEPFSPDEQTQVEPFDPAAPPRDPGDADDPDSEPAPAPYTSEVQPPVPGSYVI